MNANDINQKKGLKVPFLKRFTLADDERFTSRIPLVKRLSTKTRGHVVAVLGEGVGTFLFLFMAYAVTLNANTTTDQVVSKNLYISLGFGFSLAVNAWTFFRVSGGLFNPAVTWGMCLVGGISWLRGVLLFITQLVSAMIAAGMASALFPAGLDVQTSLSEGTSTAQGFFIEMFLTFQLVLTIFLLAAEKHRATFIAPVGIGLALFLAELAGVRYTGGSLNPARTLGPCVVNHNFHGYHWIYWIAPLTGSTLAAVIYKLIKLLEYETANPEADAAVDEDLLQRVRSEKTRVGTADTSNGQDAYTLRGATPVTSNTPYKVSSDLENGHPMPPARF